MSTGAQYVVAAYGVLLFALLMYVVAIAMRTARIAREAELLARLAERLLPPEAGAGEETALPTAEAPRPAARS